MSHSKCTLIHMDWFELGSKDAVIEYVKSNTGNGSGRAGSSPYAAIFIKECFPVGKEDLRAVNGNDLPSPDSQEPCVESKRILTTEEIQRALKSFFENGMADFGTCFAESLLGAADKVVNIDYLSKRRGL